MNKIVAVLIAGSLALGGLAAANADDDRYEHRGHHGKYCDKHGKGFGSPLERMADRLKLSDEQLKQVRAIEDKYRPEKRKLADQMRDTRKDLRAVMHADSIDQGKVKKLAQKMGSLKTEKIILRGKKHAEINKVLNKEQREQMRQWRPRHDKGYGYRHHDGV